jgi:asparaginyl-tRNA synthetase
VSASGDCPDTARDRAGHPRFFYDRDFLLVDTPILTAAIGERSGLFGTEYFDEGLLSRTDRPAVRRGGRGCLWKDLLLRSDLSGREIEDAPHLTEFWMCEPEVAFNNSDDKHAASGGVYLLPRREMPRSEDARAEGARARRQQAGNGQDTFPRINYSDAVTTLQSKGSAIKWGDDMGAEDETLLTEDSTAPPSSSIIRRRRKPFI